MSPNQQPSLTTLSALEMPQASEVPALRHLNVPRVLDETCVQVKGTTLGRDPSSGRMPQLLAMLTADMPNSCLVLQESLMLYIHSGHTY